MTKDKHLEYVYMHISIECRTPCRMSLSHSPHRPQKSKRDATSQKVNSSAANAASSSPELCTPAPCCLPAWTRAWQSITNTWNMYRLNAGHLVRNLCAIPHTDLRSQKRNASTQKGRKPACSVSVAGTSTTDDLAQAAPEIAKPTDIGPARAGRWQLSIHCLTGPHDKRQTLGIRKPWPEIALPDRAI